MRAKNAIKMGLAVAAMAAVVVGGSSDAQAKRYSLDMGQSKKLVVDLSSGPHIGPDSPFVGHWKNELHGVYGTISTFSRSETTGTQIVEFRWGGDCPGVALSLPAVFKPRENVLGGKSENEKKENKPPEKERLAFDVFGGSDCHGPLGNFRLLVEVEEENNSNTGTK